MNLSEEEKKQAEKDQYFKDWNENNINLYKWVQHGDISLQQILEESDDKRKVLDHAIKNLSSAYFINLSLYINSFLQADDTLKYGLAKKHVREIEYFVIENKFLPHSREKYLEEEDDELIIAAQFERLAKKNNINKLEEIDVNSPKCAATAMAFYNFYLCMKKYISNNKNQKSIDAECCYFVFQADRFFEYVENNINGPEYFLPITHNEVYNVYIHFVNAIKMQIYYFSFDKVASFIKSYSSRIDEITSKIHESKIASSFLTHMNTSVNDIVKLEFKEFKFPNFSSEIKYFSNQNNIKEIDLITGLRDNLLLYYCQQVLSLINKISTGVDEYYTDTISNIEEVSFMYNGGDKRLIEYCTETNTSVTLFKEPKDFENFLTLLINKKPVKVNLSCQNGEFAFFFDQLVKGKHLGEKYLEVIDKLLPFSSSEGNDIRSGNFKSSLSRYKSSNNEKAKKIQFKIMVAYKNAYKKNKLNKPLKS